MELEFQRSNLERYEPIVDTVLSQEVMAENIVPDSLPDVSRVVCTFGNAVLSAKQVAPRNVKLMGIAHLYVLYIPDMETTPRSMHLELPFQCNGDFARLNERDVVHAAILSVDGETRVLNPRKLLTKAEIKIRVQGFTNKKCETVCGLSKEYPAVQIQKSESVVHSISAALEKSFSFTDTLRQSPSKPIMEELMFHRIIPVSSEARYIGNKLICKGIMALEGAYRSGSEVIPMQFELPYSQILELEGSIEEGVPGVTVILKQTVCVLRDGELDVSVEALIQAVVWSCQSVTLLSDLYSTADALDVNRELIPLCVSAQWGSGKESFRKFCECGIPVKQVVTTWTAVGSLVLNQTEKGLCCSADALVELLFLSEDDALCCGSYSVPLTYELVPPEKCECTCSCRITGDVLAVPVTGGIEVRMDAEFTWMTTQTEQKYCVREVKMNSNPGKTHTQPSVIIRLSGADETLWDIAKSCRSTVEDICAANGLSSVHIDCGTMLIIPSKRT